MSEDNRIKEIVTDLEALSDICDTIDIKRDNAEMREIILQLKETMTANNLLALSAPQIGVNKRIFCVKDSKGIHSFINAMIKKSTQMTFSREKDESIPDKEFIYPRSGKIVVNYQTPMGETKATTVVGYSAFVFQRMIDHLNGVLISDIGLEIDEQWDSATEDERAEVLKEYAKSLDLVSKKLEDDINSDEELKKQKKAIEFEHALVAGDVKIEQRELTEEEKKLVEEKLKSIKED